MSFQYMFNGQACNVPGGCGIACRTVGGIVLNGTAAGQNATMLAAVAAFDFDNFTNVEGDTNQSVPWGYYYHFSYSSPSESEPDFDFVSVNGGPGAGADVAGLFFSENYYEPAPPPDPYQWVATRTQVWIPDTMQYFIINLAIEGPFIAGCTGSSDGGCIVELPVPELSPASDYNIYQMGVASSTFAKTDLADWVVAYVSTMTSEGAYSGTSPATYYSTWNAGQTCYSPEDDPLTGSDP